MTVHDFVNVKSCDFSACLYCCLEHQQGYVSATEFKVKRWATDTVCIKHFDIVPLSCTTDIECNTDSDNYIHCFEHCMQTVLQCQHVIYPLMSSTNYLQYCNSLLFESVLESLGKNPKAAELE